MSRKTYIAFATQFASALKLALNDTERNTIRDCAERIAQVCRTDNPKFDTARFMAACGF